MVFSGDLLKETYSKFKPEYTCWFDKSTWKYLDKYQVLCLQVQVSTKYFWISKCQVQVSTKYSRFCIKYQVSSTSTLLDPNPVVKSGSTLARLCRTHISESAGWIYTIQSSMELSRPVVVQRHGHLTLTLDFQGQVLKMLYLRNGTREGRLTWNKRDVSR